MNHDFQNRDDGQNSNEQHVIPSLGQEVTPHKSKKAYKPLFWKDTTLGGEDKDTQVTFYFFISALFTGLSSLPFPFVCCCIAKFY